MERDLTPAEFGRFRDLIHQVAGIHYPDAKCALLSNRIRRRLKARGLASYREYLRLLGQPDAAAEMQEFLDAVTTNETYFFRAPRHWEVFRAWVRERRHDRDARRNGLRIWSAAASNGAEACTAAIVLHQELGDAMNGLQIEILGTDLSMAVLHEARAGLYRPYALAQVPADVRLRYFQPHGHDQHRFDPKLAALVRFEPHNLLRPLRSRPFDFVFLRNVMIYFDQAAKETTLQHCHRLMHPGAMLLVGESESLLNVRHEFTYLEPSVFQKALPLGIGR